MRTPSSIEDKNESWNCSVSEDGFENQIQNPKKQPNLVYYHGRERKPAEISHNICSFMHNQNSINLSIIKTVARGFSVDGFFTCHLSPPKKECESFQLEVQR